MYHSHTQCLQMYLKKLPTDTAVQLLRNPCLHDVSVSSVHDTSWQWSAASIRHIMVIVLFAECGMKCEGVCWCLRPMSFLLYCGVQCEAVCRCTEFFEELLSLVYSLTSRHISSRMWQILPHLYQLFFDDNIDLFVGESMCNNMI